jgi:hypoxanthine phosphoribosyltransferase
MSQLEVFLTKEQIAQRVTELGKQISADYAGREVVLVGVLRGCFIFMADLSRAMDLQVMVDFMEVTSYEGTTSSGSVKIVKDIKNSIEGKHVLLIEDIVDTGLTLSFVVGHLMLKKPASVEIAGLLVKAQKHAYRAPIRYQGFQIPDHFVVGYGMDCAGKYRNLDHIAIYRE